MKCNKFLIIGIPEGEKKKRGIETLFQKIKTENFLKLERINTTQIQEAQRVPFKKNPKRPTPRHILIKMAKFKVKEKILKAAREK